MDGFLSGQLPEWAIVGLVAAVLFSLVRWRLSFTEPPNPDPDGLLAARIKAENREIWKRKQGSWNVLLLMMALLAMRWLLGFEITVLSALAVLVARQITTSEG